MDEAVETERSRSGQASMASVGDSTSGGEDSLSLNGLGIVIDIGFVGVDSADSAVLFAGMSREVESCFGVVVSTAVVSMSWSVTCSFSGLAATSLLLTSSMLTAKKSTRRVDWSTVGVW